MQCSQVLGEAAAGQIGRPAVNVDLDAVFSTETDVVVVIDADPGRYAEQGQRVFAGGVDVVFHVQDDPVRPGLYQGPDSGHLRLLQIAG